MVCACVRSSGGRGAPGPLHPAGRRLGPAARAAEPYAALVGPGAGPPRHCGRVHRQHRQRRAHAQHGHGQACRCGTSSWMQRSAHATACVGGACSAWPLLLSLGVPLAVPCTDQVADVLVCGGGALIPGLSQRLVHELKALCPAEPVPSACTLPEYIPVSVLSALCSVRGARPPAPCLGCGLTVHWRTALGAGGAHARARGVVRRRGGGQDFVVRPALGDQVGLRRGGPSRRGAEVRAMTRVARSLYLCALLLARPACTSCQSPFQGFHPTKQARANTQVCCCGTKRKSGRAHDAMQSARQQAGCYATLQARQHQCMQRDSRASCLPELCARTNFHRAKSTR